MARPVVPDRPHVPWTLAAILALGVAYAGTFFSVRHQHESDGFEHMLVACGCSDGTKCTVQRVGHWPWGVRKRMPDGAFAVVRDDAGDLFEVSCESGNVLLGKLPAVRT